MMKILLTFLALTACLRAEKPNILFLFSDDHAIGSISAYPGGLFDEIAPTPGIDRIANEGLRFDRAYCTNSICGPSRASILTGKHSHLNGFIDNTASYFDGLQQTFPPLLQKAGYRTAMIGKWHLESDPVGFDYWEILPGQGQYYNPDFIQMDGTKKVFPGHCNDLVTEKGLTWLRKAAGKKDQPFMAMIQYKAPHRNWEPAVRHLDLFKDIEMPKPKTLFDDYENRSELLKEHEMGIAGNFSWDHDMKFEGENLFPKYFTSQMKASVISRANPEELKAWRSAYGPENEKFIADMKAGKLDDKAIIRWKYQRYIKDYLRTVRSMDEGIAQILAYLDESGLAKNTIVFYSSDQGFYLGEHGWFDKRWMFEESFRMPLLVRWPGVIKPGSDSQALVQNIDYGPTFLDLVGAEVPESMQGVSLVPILKASGKAPVEWRDSLYYAYYGESVHHVARHDGVATDRYKLMYFPKTDEFNLFDLETDPDELNSVHDEPDYASTLAEMKDRLVKMREKYHAHSAVLPEARFEQDWWGPRHKEKVAEAKSGPHDLIFIGDSITHSFENSGKEVWKKFYEPRQALNLGFSGDRTEHVLWRLNNGELSGQKKAKLAVLMIGTNNTGHKKQDPSETADGVEMILSTLRARLPDTKVLLLAVFPRDEKPDGEYRKINDELNKKLEKLADGQRVHYFDISDKFLDETGILPKSTFPDSLHPNTAGYQIWAEAIEPKIEELMK